MNSLANLASSRPQVRCRFRRAAVKVWAGKGFAKKPKKSTPAKGQDGQKKKMQKAKQPVYVNPMAPTPPSPNSRDEQFRERMEQMKDGTKEEQDEFSKRIADLKAKGKSVQSSMEEEDIFGNGSNGSKPLAPLDAISAKSPTRQKPKSVEEEEDSKTGLGIPQIAVGFITLALAAIFVITSGTPPPTSSGQDSQISEEGLKALRERAEDLGKKIKESPKDLDAQRQLLDVNIVLGDDKKAKEIAEQLVKMDETNSDSWLALGEVKTRLKDYKGAAVAFEKSLGLSDKPVLAQYQGLAGALVGNKQYEEAVEKLQSYESKAVGEGGEIIGPVEVQLLIAKVYSQWDKHFSSALAVYDGLIEKHPDDFRIYLAKGKLLKDKGRKGDATRMFIQAKYLAPPEARAAVDQISNK